MLIDYLVIELNDNAVGRNLGDMFPPHGATAPSGPGPPDYGGFTITLRHTTLGRTPLEE